MEYLIADERAALVPYSHEQDAGDWLKCWQDPATQQGYNFIMPDDPGCIMSQEVSRFPFWATAVDQLTDERIGVLRLSPDPEEPDLAIWVYPSYRGIGWGTRIYRLALMYLAGQGYESVYAGCFEHNTASWRMLSRLGFVRLERETQEERSVLDGSSVRMHSFVWRQ